MMNARARRGFSLMEMAVSIGAISIVLAGIWAASTAVRNKQRVDDAVSIMSIVADNMRAMYSGQINAATPTISGATGLVCAKVFPLETWQRASTDVCSTASPRSPFGGTLSLAIATPSASGRSFTVGFSGVSASDITSEQCQKIIQGMAPSLPTAATSTTSTLAGGVALPVLSSPPAMESSQMGLPIKGYVQTNAGAWTDVTALSPVQIVSLFSGANKCTGVALAYSY